MKTILFVAAFSIGIGLPLTSEAQLIALGVQLPVERTLTNENIRGGYVAKNLGDTFRVQKLQNTGHIDSTKEDSEKDIYYVFGVKVAVDKES
jgi:hypothetical protein